MSDIPNAEIVAKIDRLVKEFTSVLCQDPCQVSSETRSNGKVMFVEIIPSTNDIGKTLGREGRLIKPLREVFEALGQRHNIRVVMEVRT